jgi:hypothetical protein
MYTIEEIICEIRRELSVRQSFYPFATAKGDLDQAEAARRIGIIQEILEHYLALEEDDREQGKLFLKAVPMRWVTAVEVV